MSRLRISVLLVLAALALALAASAAARGPGAPVVAGAEACPVFPAASPWNQRVDRLPVHRRSRAIVRAIGRNAPLHPDFAAGTWDGGPIGIPYTVVPGDQRRVPVSFAYADESDPGPYPIPPDAPIEGGPDADGDRHVIVVDRDACRVYELYDAHPVQGGRSWRAGSGATWDLRSTRLRPRGWTSADAAGLPILPGLARPEEVARGHLGHALRFTAPRTRRAFVWPARHFASHLTSRSLPAMGQRVRLRRSFPLRGFGPQARVILRTLKRYGMILADNGSPWYVTGVPSPRWDDDDLHGLRRVRGRDFEVVDARSLRRAR